jgi:glycosyltransferase involved in cell wall biosynthesis
MQAGNCWLILTQYYAPEMGAPQVRLRALAKELKSSGAEVRVLTALPNYPTGKIFHNYSGRWQVSEKIDDIPVTRTWVYAGTGRSVRVRLMNYLSFTLTSSIAALTGPRPNVLFVESQPLSLGLIAVLMKWFRRVPYVYNVPDLQVDVAKQLGFINSKTALGLAQKLEDFFLRRAWKVSTVTKQFIEHIKSRGIDHNKITFLPNGADIGSLRDLPPCQELITRWALQNKKVFLYVGTHAYYHGLDTIIDAATLLKDNNDIAFLMVGEGPERERLKGLAKDRGLNNVVFAQSPLEEMARLYSVAYASIATLRDMKVAKLMRLSKVFPSLSCGVPVIYSGSGEMADLLRENNCGVVVEPENPAALMSSIISLANAKETRERMGRAGRILVEKEYSWQVIIRNWLDELNGNQRIASK